MNDKTMTKADFAASIVIILASALILFFSFRMPTYEEWGLYATPNLAPVAFGILLLICGLILFVRSVVQKGYRISISREDILRVYRSKAVKHFFAALGLVVIYYLAIGNVHFILISSIYLFLNILYFKSIVWWKNVLVSVISAVAIWFLFNDLFLIPLP